MKIRSLGLWSSVAATVFGLIYTAAQLFSLAGGIPTPWDIFWMVLPSLFLAWSYMLMMLCLYRVSERERNAGAMAGAAFSVIYASINTIVYFTILTFVIPGILNGRADELTLFLFEPGKFLFNLNGIAYTLMSVAAFFGSFTFAPKTFLRRAMALHGLVAPLICAAVLWDPVKYAGALWIITFPLMGIAAILYFKNVKIIQRLNNPTIHQSKIGEGSV